MEIIGLAAVAAVAVAFFTRGVPDLQAAEEAVERAKEAAGMANDFGPWDLAALIAKIVLIFVVAVTLGAALIGAGLLAGAL